MPDKPTIFSGKWKLISITPDSVEILSAGTMQLFHWYAERIKDDATAILIEEGYLKEAKKEQVDMS